MKAAKSGVMFFILITAGILALRAQSGPAAGAGNVEPVSQELTQEAVRYYQNLSAPLQSFKQANYDYIQAITRLRKAKTVEKKRQELLKAIQSYKDTVNKAGSFHGDSTLKSELIQCLDLDYIVLKQDFDKILDMEDVEAQSYDQAEAHQLAIDMAVEKMHASFDVLKKAENGFFGRYRITSKEVKDDLTLKIERANRAFGYYDSVSRVFSKVNREYCYTIGAVDSHDVAGLEQHTATLVSFSQDGLEKLKRKSGYDNDSGLLSIAIKVLEFYLQEGQVTCKADIDFSMKADEMQKADKRLKSIKENERKKEDIEQYNNEVNAYNKAVKEINRANKASYKTHKKLLKLWNKEVAEFFKKHS